MFDFLKKAINSAGGRKQFAEAVGVSEMAVSYWLRGTRITSEYISPIVRASKGTVTHEELCDELERLAKERKAKRAKKNED